MAREAHPTVRRTLGTIPSRTPVFSFMNPFETSRITYGALAARRPQPLIFDRGTRGSREDQFLYPRCVVAHPLEGDLYVVDAGNHRVLELNSAGIVKSVFGSRGSGTLRVHFTQSVHTSNAHTH